MNYIIKAITTYVPDSCKECCAVIDEKRYGEHFSGWVCGLCGVDVEDETTRPDWCPLVTESEE